MSFERLAGRTAVVTGASSGIGRAIAMAFHREGAQVVCADTTPAGPRKAPGSEERELPTHEQIANNGGKAVFIQADMTKADEVKGLVKEAVSRFGRIDVFVNNAGVVAEDTDSEETWDRAYAVNSRGAFLGCKYAGSQMKKQDQLPSLDRGWIINIASMAQAGTAASSDSKHAVVSDLTKSLATEYATHRVHVNCITPGYTKVETNDDATMETRQPRGLGLPEDIAKMAVYLASEENSWMAGAAIPVDGGFTA